MCALFVLSGSSCSDTQESRVAQQRSALCLTNSQCGPGEFCVLGACCADPCGDVVCGVGTLGACDDGDPCTENDSCATGACLGTAKSGVCGQGLVCAQGACVPGCWIDGGVVDAGLQRGCLKCDPANAPLTWTIAEGSMCDDQNACTGGETCDGNGNCSPSTVTVCPTPRCYQPSMCDTQTGACSAVKQADGTPCSADGGYCFSGACVAACATDAGVVADGTQNPNNPCEVCNVAHTTATWSPAPEDTACAGRDGGCVLWGCRAGKCGATGVAACPPIDACHLEGTCETQLDRCTAPLAPTGTACDAGVACATQSTCVVGVCTPDLAQCACNDDADCLPAPSCRVPKCRSHVCTFDVADDGTGCDDGDWCSLGDHCVAGACTSNERKICAEQACATATCDADLQGCATTPANEGLPCDGGVCVDGACAQTDGGVSPDPFAPVEFTTCGCDAGGGGFSLFALALLAWRRRRPFLNCVRKM